MRWRSPVALAGHGKHMFFVVTTAHKVVLSEVNAESGCLFVLPAVGIRLNFCKSEAFTDNAEQATLVMVRIKYRNYKAEMTVNDNASMLGRQIVPVGGDPIPAFVGGLAKARHTC
jgi:hypothetical protein